MGGMNAALPREGALKIANIIARNIVPKNKKVPRTKIQKAPLREVFEYEKNFSGDSVL